MEDANTLMKITIPEAMTGLTKSSNDVSSIALWCKNAADNEQNLQDVFKQTQDYVKSALSNVSFHIHTVAVHLVSFLQQQSQEAEQLEWHMKVLADRMKIAHDSAGMNGLRTADAAAKYKRLEKTRKVSDSPYAQPLPRYVRRTLDLNVLNNVGMDLSGNRGTDSFNVLTSSQGPMLRGEASATQQNIPRPAPLVQSMKPIPPPPQQHHAPPPQHHVPPPPPMHAQPAQMYPPQSQYQEPVEDQDDAPPPPPPPRVDDDEDAPPPPPPG